MLAEELQVLRVIVVAGEVMHRSVDKSRGTPHVGPDLHTGHRRCSITLHIPPSYDHQNPGPLAEEKSHPHILA